MLSTRSLPPQFLLPAWSAQQLAGLVQRAHISTDGRPNDPDRPHARKQRASRSSDHNSPGKSPWRYVKPTVSDAPPKNRTVDGRPDIYSRPRPLGKPNSKYAVKRLSNLIPKSRTAALETFDEMFPSRRPSTEKKASALALFDEVFPDQKATNTKSQKLAERPIEKLPAFQWKHESEILAEERQKQQQREKEAANERVQALARTRWNADRASRDEPALLVLDACSTTLEASDFYRLSPKGEHITAWKSGLLKVIPGRDFKTLQPLGNYFLLFTDHAAAKAYLDQTIRLHVLTKLQKKKSETKLPLPPGYLKEGDNLQELLKGYSLVPGFVSLHLKLIDRPYSDRMKALIRTGGPAAAATRNIEGEHLVLFTTDHLDVTHEVMSIILAEDGRRRNLQWDFARDRFNSIVKLGLNSDNQPAPVHDRYGAGRYTGGSRFVISLKDAQEAKRFVREWHRRPLPSTRYQTKHSLNDSRQENEPPPIINAEILW